MVPVGYVRVGFTLGMSISCCFFPFFARVVTQRNVVSGGIWALVYLVRFPVSNPPRVVSLGAREGEPSLLHPPQAAGADPGGTARPRGLA